MARVGERHARRGGSVCGQGTRTVSERWARVGIARVREGKRHARRGDLAVSGCCGNRAVSAERFHAERFRAAVGTERGQLSGFRLNGFGLLWEQSGCS